MVAPCIIEIAPPRCGLTAIPSPPLLLFKYQLVHKECIDDIMRLECVIMTQELGLNDSSGLPPSYLEKCVRLYTKGVFKAPFPGLVVMWSKVHQYLTDGVVQSACSTAFFTIEKGLNLCHGLSGQSDGGIIVCRVFGLYL